jgi:parallel beta-helix repeat protein
MKRYALFVTIALFVSLFIVSGASAVIRCVNATPILGCPSYTTIQAAVDDSVATDIIVVHPGIYYENVVVTGKNNIAIQGGKVVVSFGRLSIQSILPEQAVVDAKPVFDTCTGPGFYIDAANNISIKSLTVRHACADGVSGDNIYSTGNFTFIDKVNSLSSQEDGIQINGSNATVQNSSIFGNWDYGINIYGDYALVQINNIWNQGEYGVYIDGQNAKVTKNNIVNSNDDDAIYLSYGSHNSLISYNTVQSCYEGIYVYYSDNVEISNNTLRNTYYEGIYVYGAYNTKIKNNTVTGTAENGITAYNVTNSLIDRNNVSAILHQGIYVYTSIYSYLGYNTVSNNIVENVSEDKGINIVDAKPTVTGNTVRNISEDDCYYIDCGSGSTCSSGQVSGNTAMHCGEDSHGFVIKGDYLMITGNTAEHIYYDGFNIEGDDNTFQSNNARWCGTDSIDQAGFNFSSGNNNLIKSNLAEFNSGRGFDIEGSNTVTQNTSRKNYRTGMHFGYAGGGTLNVTYNTVTDNHGEGIANFAPNGGGSLVNISNNTVLRNRTDICNEDTIDTFISNIFTTGGIATFCDIE